jgi:hypothetical protein
MILLGTQSFALAPMSRMIRILTIILLGIPIVLILAPLRDPRAFPIVFVGICVALLYGVIWFLMRPSAFVIRPEGVEIVWPLRRRVIPKGNIVGVELVSPEDLRHEFGLLLRFGAGGLWGGFGLALSTQGKHLGLLVSRHRDGFVLLRCEGIRSILLTPSRPSDFVATVRGLSGTR